MRNLNLLDIYRDTSPDVIELMGWIGDATCGAFTIPSPTDSAPLRVIASVGLGWEHVSVSRKNRCPNWQEMDHVKRLFFLETEAVMQIHPPVAEYVNFCDTCLHLWRPTSGDFPRHPKELVGAPA